MMIMMRTSLKAKPQTKMAKNHAMTNSLAYSGVRKMKSFRASSLFSAEEYVFPLMSIKMTVMIIDMTQKRKIMTRPTTLHHRN